jgi:hypothetical protein
MLLPLLVERDLHKSARSFRHTLSGGSAAGDERSAEASAPGDPQRLAGQPVPAKTSRRPVFGCRLACILRGPVQLAAKLDREGGDTSEARPQLQR